MSATVKLRMAQYQLSSRKDHVVKMQVSRRCVQRLPSGTEDLACRLVVVSPSTCASNNAAPGRCQRRGRAAGAKKQCFDQRPTSGRLALSDSALSIPRCSTSRPRPALHSRSSCRLATRKSLAGCCTWHHTLRWDCPCGAS